MAKKASEFIKPKQITVTTLDKEEKKYVISRFDAETGREVISQYPLTGAPKIGDYKENKKLMFIMMEHVAVVVEDDEGKTMEIALSSPDLYNNHVPDFETSFAIEREMMEYNCSFFSAGKISGFLDLIAQNAAKWITSMSTDSLEPSSQQTKQPS